MTRNWSEYNEKLVKRGEFYLSPDFLDSWDEELERMNKGKVGRPYEFPESFIQFAALWHRFKDLKIEVPKSDDIIVAVDSTGIKVTNRGEWMRKTHRGERRGWIKVHVVVDVGSKELLSIEVTDERTGDSEVFEDLVEDLDPKDCLGDGGYDDKEVFEILEEKGLDPPGIKIRKDARTGLSPRGQAAKEFQELGYEEWKKKHEYGKRWAVEGFFSAVKRCFGERVRAASPEGMMREVKRKFALYNLVTRV